MSTNSSSSPSQTSCPECQGTVVTGSGETFCRDCGLIVDECDQRPSPTARFGTGNEQREGGRRTGPATSNTYHDNGLSTNISIEETDANGAPLSSNQRLQVRRLERTHRYFNKDSNDRRLREGLSELQRLAEALELPDLIHEDAAQCYREASSEGLLKGRSIEGVAGACVYIAAQRAESPQTYADFEMISRVDIAKVKRSVLALQQSLDIQVAPLSPEDYISRVTAAIDADPQVETRAAAILAEVPTEELHSGKSLVGWAATAVYRAAQYHGDVVTQDELRDGVGISTRTVQKRLQTIEAVTPRPVN